MKNILFITLTLLFSFISYAQSDCTGIPNGSSLEDDCGDCQQAYIYNFITHSVTFISNTEGVETGPNETIVMPDDPGNPYWNQSCTDVPGCTDMTACNFNYLATIDDGTCGITDDCDECQVPYCYNPITHEVTYVGVDDCEFSFISGTGGSMSNLDSAYNPYWNSSCSDCTGIPNGSSLEDDCGDCQQAYIYNFITHSVTFISNTEGVETGPNETIVMPDDPGNPYWNQSCTDVPGCTNPNADNFNYLATIDDGSCIILGCTDSNALNFDINATDDDSTCIYIIEGCTDVEAYNWNPDANTDDGSCIIYGCTYDVASNYNPNANDDDGSCEFSNSNCPSDLNEDGTVATSDLLIFLGDFGSTCN